MSLARAWVKTLADGLVRADQIIGIDAHRSPTSDGRTPHWLIDVVLPAQFGSGAGRDWTVDVLHRTLIQTRDDPGDAPVALARLLAQLDAISADGIITADAPDNKTAPSTQAPRTPGEGGVQIRFQFSPFAPLPTGQHTGSEYL